MKYLNLTKGFNPFSAQTTETTIDFEAFIFNGGEPHIKLSLRMADVSDKIMISHIIRNGNDLLLLAEAVDAIRRVGVGVEKSIALFLPYFPGARQDRRMVSGEPLTVKVYADIINSMGFESVTIFDPHSDVTPAVINNCFVIDNHKFADFAVMQSWANEEDLLIVSPDAGSNKKMKDFMAFINTDSKLTADSYYDLVKCDKTRDQKTGKITGFEVYAEDLKGKACIIVDDICDGGGTFIGLAEELKKKGAGNLYLAVSHGIFSKGLKPFDGLFKHIYTTDSFIKSLKVLELNNDLKEDILTQVKLEDLL